MKRKSHWKESLRGWLNLAHTAQLVFQKVHPQGAPAPLRPTSNILTDAGGARLSRQSHVSNAHTRGELAASVACTHQ